MLIDAAPFVSARVVRMPADPTRPALQSARQRRPKATIGSRLPALQGILRSDYARTIKDNDVCVKQTGEGGCNIDRIGKTDGK